jgi:hypothetical protein
MIGDHHRAEAPKGRNLVCEEPSRAGKTGDQQKGDRFGHIRWFRNGIAQRSAAFTLSSLAEEICVIRH